MTNTLCVHYLAYHRIEVPALELDRVLQLPPGNDVPSRLELCAPEYRDPPTSVTLRLDDDIHEDVDAHDEIIRWRYELLVDNRADVVARLMEASFVLSLDSAYLLQERWPCGWLLKPGEVRRVPHTAVFRVAEFRQDRPAYIARSLSVASRKAVRWLFEGSYASGQPLGADVELVR